MLLNFPKTQSNLKTKIWEEKKMRIRASLHYLYHDFAWSCETGNWVNPATKSIKKLDRMFGQEEQLARNCQQKDVEIVLKILANSTNFIF